MESILNHMVVLLAIIAVIMAGIILLVFIIANKLLGKDAGIEWPFYAKKLMSRPEQVLYFRLCKAMPQHVVLAQVQLSRFLGVKRGHNYMLWHNRINRMSADFVICNKDSSVVAVIELDDSSHQADRRKSADYKKDRAIRSANIQIVRWNVNTMPDEAKIQAELYDLLRNVS